MLASTAVTGRLNFGGSKPGTSPCVSSLNNIRSKFFSEITDRNYHFNELDNTFQIYF